MSQEILPPKHIAVLVHPNLEEAKPEARRIAGFLQSHGIEDVTIATIYDEAMTQKAKHGDFDLLIALGGDGTMLRVSRLAAPLGIPILGFNLGSVGFLMEVQRQESGEELELLLQGKFRIEPRILLHASLIYPEGTPQTWEVVNDVTITRDTPNRPIRLHTSVDGYPMASYLADGLVIATPTGSTAYALAAGGPVLPPELHNLEIVPIAPHLCLDRAIVLPDSAEVSVRIDGIHPAVVSIDGQPPLKMQKSDEVRIKVSEHVVKYVRFHNPGYFFTNLTRSLQRNAETGDSHD
jgi:NAD+ kinase